MGWADSIADLASRNGDFRDFLAGMEKDLRARSADARSQLREWAAEFYLRSGFTDATNLLDGCSVDFVDVDAFSLQKLADAITATAAAVFSGHPEPAGACLDRGGIQTAGKALAARSVPMGDIELLVTATVFTRLARVVLDFGAGRGMRSSFEVTRRSESLGFGFQLFTFVAVTVSEHDGMHVAGYLHTYELKFSAQQASTEPARDLLEAYEDGLVTLHTRLNDLLKQAGTGNLDMEALQPTLQIYQRLIDRYVVEIGKLRGT